MWFIKKKKQGMLAPVPEAVSVSIATGADKLQHRTAEQLTKWENRLDVQQRKYIALVFLIAGFTACSLLLVKGISGNRSTNVPVMNKTSVVQPPALQPSRDSSARSHHPAVKRPP